MNSTLSSTDKFARFAERYCGLRLEPFQRIIIEEVFSDRRESLILLPRGNGKSSLLAALGLFHPLSTPNAAAYVAAASREQAQVLFDMARTGIAVIVISSELSEVMAVSDRIVTFREGRITGVMSAAEATEEKLMQRMALGAGDHHVHAEAA